MPNGAMLKERRLANPSELDTMRDGTLLLVS